jgi:hypothetical protein
MNLATPTLSISEYTGDAGIVHIDTDQTTTVGLKAKILLALDWKPMPNKGGGPFGAIERTYRRLRISLKP